MEKKKGVLKGVGAKKEERKSKTGEMADFISGTFRRAVM